MRNVCAALLLVCTPLLAAKTEEIKFANGDVGLRGILVLPDSAPPYPALVLLPGSGPPGEANLRIAQRFADGGYAALVTMKRTSWWSASLDDLAADGAAAVRALASRGDIDAKRLGLFAISQSGWYAPLIADREKAISFLITVTGGGVAPREVEWYTYEASLARRGVTGDDLRAARALIREYFHYLATGDDRDVLVAAVAAAKSQSWYPAVGIDGARPDEKIRPAWQWVAMFDPAPSIERLRVPVLLMFGGRDDVPAEESIRRWSAALRRGGNENVTIRLFPEAGHGMTLGEHGHGTPVYAVGYFETMLAWLASQTR